MQLLLDSLSDDEKETRKNDDIDLNDSRLITLEKRLTYDEIKANLKMFMLAGYESTSYALSYCVYMLAINKEEEQKLLDEIKMFYYDETKVLF